MKMRESLSPKEWDRVRQYVAQFTQAEIEKKHPGKLATALFRVSQGKPAGNGYGGGGAGNLSTALITEALKWCKQLPGPNAAGRVESIQE